MKSTPSQANTMDAGSTAEAPSLPWRIWSNTTMFGVAGLCRAFLSGLCHAEVHGHEEFTALLDSRKDPAQRSKGLITGKVLRQHLRQRK
jgi:monolysocardiolipin acyltransferase